MALVHTLLAAWLLACCMCVTVAHCWVSRDACHDDAWLVKHYAGTAKEWGHSVTAEMEERKDGSVRIKIPAAGIDCTYSGKAHSNWHGINRGDECLNGFGHHVRGLEFRFTGKKFTVSVDPKKGAPWVNFDFPLTRVKCAENKLIRDDWGYL